MQGRDPVLKIRRYCIARSAFSLLELLTVIAVISLLLALAVPGLAPLAPSRMAAIHELASFLHQARAEGLALREERAVGFVGQNTPSGQALRSYALFRPYRAEGVDKGIEKPIEFRRVSAWRRLPEGTIFAKGEDLGFVDGVRVQSVHDFALSENFSVLDEERDEMLPSHCLIFGADGGVISPTFTDADVLTIGIVEGYCDSRSKERFFTAHRVGSDGRKLPLGAWLEVFWRTGYIRVLNE